MNPRTSLGRQARVRPPGTTAAARQPRDRARPGPALPPFFTAPHRTPVPLSAHPTARAVRVRRSPR
ncbi:predicted protein [Streptomyces viridosporus ATCC 14672]|uniref:Predicted protein n=1 Tax=Streptomyces viridosporus (strain ATCC 14672 / DSM 40746 / JCM 4963 / KCTC 9882 / NRRL B-12104 / FH 1290) TaxID=566461 RepID=D5ZWD6_STRV1|nr:predicted protein [Streptomyces viridosporus ATCC 14672]